MLMLLVAFLLGSLLMPVLVRWLGPRAFAIAALVPAAAFVQALVVTPQVLDPQVAPFETVPWIPQLGLELSMHMDVLGWVLTLIVTGVGALVLLYCRWYFHDDATGLGQFSGVLLGFAGAMYGLVLTDDLVMLVMFWEVTSILSYLLIGHYRRRAASRRAALQALLVTTLGGLVMFVGVVLLVVDAGTTSITEILALAPTGPTVDAAIVMLLIGAISKSALFPFHFWLPGAMAAPTPVSAYLHAAAMVKAGIYLIARFAPIFAFTGPWRPIIVSLGVLTMLIGGIQALRETDLKRILAFGTVSQLGFFAVVVGYGSKATALAGLALVIGHALFKSALFLIVGVIDRQLSTRDIDELSGVGRQAPVMATAAFISVASMVGIAPTIGFVAKESTLTALLDAAVAGEPWGLVALIGVIVGSMLTAAYGARFLWGAFWTKRDERGDRMPETVWPDPPVGFLSAPIVLAAATIARRHRRSRARHRPPRLRPHRGGAALAGNPTRGTSRSGTGSSRHWASRSCRSCSASASSCSRAARAGTGAPGYCRSRPPTPTTSWCAGSTGSRCSARPSPSADRCRCTSARFSSSSSPPR